MPRNLVAQLSAVQPYVKLLLPPTDSKDKKTQYINLTQGYKIPEAKSAWYKTIEGIWLKTFNFYGHGTNAFALYNMLNLTQAQILPGDELLKMGIPILPYFNIAICNYKGSKHIYSTNYGIPSAGIKLNRRFSKSTDCLNLEELKNRLKMFHSKIKEEKEILDKEGNSPNLIAEDSEVNILGLPSYPHVYYLNRMITLSQLLEQFICELEKNPEYLQTYQKLHSIPMQIFFDSPEDKMHNWTGLATSYTQQVSEIKAIACKDEHRSIIEDMIAKTPYKLPIVSMDNFFDAIDKCEDIQDRYKLFTDLVEYKYSN